MKLYIASVVITYVPLVVTAARGPFPLWSRSRCPTTPECPRLLFLHDWTIAFALLVSFPLLVFLLSTDERVLIASLRQVEENGVIRASRSRWNAVVRSWQRRFPPINIVLQCIALVLGAVLAWITQRAYVSPPVGFWISVDTKLLPVGYVYTGCIALFYALIILYVARSIVLSLLLNDLVASSSFRMIPSHPDRCGGLRPVGQLGLRNQYTVTLLGLNVVLLAYTSFVDLAGGPMMRQLVITAAVAYLILGPIVFIGPLLPFSWGMTNAKSEWLKDMAQRLRLELERIRQRVQTDGIAEGDDASVDRLQKLIAVIDELPVWPFDSRTLRKFTTAYLLPVSTALLGKGFALLWGVLGISR